MNQTLPVLTCDGCGICCMHMSTPPYDTEERILLRHNQPVVHADLIAVLESRRLQFDVHGTDYVPCGFFDMVTRKCRHYEHRPEVCRDFEMGSVYCRNFRNDAGLVTP